MVQGFGPSLLLQALDLQCSELLYSSLPLGSHRWTSAP